MPELDDANFVIFNFSCTRLDRCNGLCGGGIAFYCKKGLKTTIKLKSCQSSAIELLGIEVGLNRQKCLFIGVYTPNRSNHLESLFGKLSNISPEYENLIMC